MSAAEPVPSAAAVFAALGDPTRLALLAALSDGAPRSIATLTGGGRITRQAVTKHLRVLERAGLVRDAPFGRERRFAYRPDQVVAARACLDRIAAQWDEALDRLRVLVEGDG